MNDSLKHKIFIETDCISEQAMFDYIDKKLSAKENHSVEKHLLSCELCSDALDGLEVLKSRTRISSLNQNIGERIAAPIVKKETKTISFYYKLAASIAAAIILLLGGVFFFEQINKKNETASVAELKPQSSPSQFDLKDKTVLDSAPSNSPPPPPESKKAEDLETKARTGAEEKSKLKEAPVSISAEQKVSQKYFKTPAGVHDAAKSIAAGKADSPEQQLEVRRETAADEQMTGYAVTPKGELRDREKGAKPDKAEKSEDGAGSLSNMQSITLSEPASPAKAPAASAAPANEGQNASYAFTDQLAKKSKSNKAYGSGSAGKDKDAKETLEIDEVSTVNNIPKSIAANDDRNSKRASNAESGQKPEFPGGQDSLLKFISRNFKYPVAAKNEKASDRTIFVQLTIDEKGNVKKSKVVKGINSELDKEALRVVSIMPKWKPAVSNGNPVQQKVNVPIKLTY